jgi:calcineurin-like phosphoesterase
MHDSTTKRITVILIGDIVGDPGLIVLERRLPALIDKTAADFVVVNGENAAAGFGLTAEILNRIYAAGADVVTSGNHIWEKRELWPVLNADAKILRPANYPENVPGHGFVKFEKNGIFWLVINLQGREQMPPLIDCPFQTFDHIYAEQMVPEYITHELYTAAGQVMVPACTDNTIVIVDFHAEISQEKEALGFYLDGRASIVVGTHTHVQTADEKILPNGTGYITDLGMTGVLASIIGMDTSLCLSRARTQIAYRLECAVGPAAIHGISVEIDPATRKALSIQRINDHD